MNEEKEEFDKKKKKRKKWIIIILIIAVFLISLFFYIKPFILVSNDDKIKNDDNIKYLTNKYGNNLSINFVSKKKNVWLYKLCSKKAPFCVNIKYKNNRWLYPKGESFVYALLFMDQSITTLDNYSIEYKAYIDSKNTLTRPNNFILVINKKDTSSLINAIKEINSSNYINLIYDKDNQNVGSYEINIFNSDDYNIITKKLTNYYDVSGYYQLYEILANYDDNAWSTKLGNNIQRHYINDNMFDCTIDDCDKYKHIAYRYVIGSHNYVDNTMIIEGV